MSTSHPHIYIGKIPGYNPKLTSRINYEERLKNNLTIATFTPTGYQINLQGIKDLKTFLPGSSDTGNFSTMYKIGKNLNSLMSAGDSQVNTSSALTIWQNMQKQMMTDLAGNIFSAPCDEFSIISTNDSTINETISNEYAPNVASDFSSVIGAISGKAGEKFKALQGLSSTISQGAISVDSTQMIEILRKKNELSSDNQFLNNLTSQAIGIQTALPKIWKRSDYNNTSSFTIKLVSPSGHPDDVKYYVLDPLIRLILAASPITFDGVSYGYPPLWKVQAKGLLHTNLSAISAIVITRGGQDTLFNRYNQPTNIDVRLTIEPLVSGFATPLVDGISYKPNESTNEVKMLLANPMAITNSMDTKEESKSIVLNTLVL